MWFKWRSVSCDVQDAVGASVSRPPYPLRALRFRFARAPCVPYRGGLPLGGWGLEMSDHGENIVPEKRNFQEKS